MQYACFITLVAEIITVTHAKVATLKITLTLTYLNYIIGIKCMFFCNSIQRVIKRCYAVMKWP